MPIKIGDTVTLFQGFIKMKLKLLKLIKKQEEFKKELILSLNILNQIQKMK
jgi:hypothetical protein